MTLIRRKITYGCFRKVFLLICATGFFLLTYYLYYEKYEISMDSDMARKKIDPNLFKRNASHPIRMEACSLTENQDEDVVAFLILSASHKSFRRQIIRGTWGQSKVMLGLKMKLFFIIEDSNDTNIFVQNNMESMVFGDIIRTQLVQPHFHQSLIGLQWILLHCPAAKFIVQANDDVFINPFTLREFVQKLQTISSPTSFVPDDNSQMMKDYESNFKPQLNKFHQISSNKEIQSLSSHPNQNDDDKVYQPRWKQNDFLNKLLFSNKAVISRDLRYAIIPPKSPTQNMQNIDESKVSKDDFVLRDVNKTLFCLVWPYSPELINTKWSVKDNIPEDDTFRTFCSGVAYIMSKPVSKLLIAAQLKIRVSDGANLSENEYVTGLLAKWAGVGHAQIGSKYAFKSRNAKAIATGNKIFTHLDKDIEKLTPEIWNIIEEEQFKKKLSLS